ncbi:cytochrome b-c1 complex subunit 1, mitochondrial-like [Trichoplusia ni]|uniref:Cytochrome b-c1 complex subunit 1, mitochondrial-like n=1 Tax=Trichoplusia ni TaxID=7111 RepID=A0A7E5WWM8_TRINI|nr:cytochrome b-c1 complex subunit 1, mitochondrial-like [Trichoplusia ni]
MSIAARLSRAWRPLKYSFRSYTSNNQFMQFLQNLPCTQYSKLVNGLTVVTEERESYNSCIGLFMDAGPRYESNFENGITHFFEHIAFKSTRARTKPELEAQLERIGARFKCFTTREMSVYYVECLCHDTPIATDLLTDCVFNNAFATTDIENQKRTVYAEMIAHDDNPEAVIYDYLHSSAFQGTPLAATVMGPSGNLYNFTDATICRYLSKCFDPCRTVLVAVGGVKHEQMVALANSYLIRLEPLKCMDIDAYRFSGSEVRFRDDSLPLATVLAAVEAPSFIHEDNVVMEVARYIVGGYDRSQPGTAQTHWSHVARTGKEEKSFDAFKAFYITYKDCGLWGVHFTGLSTQLDNMMIILQDELMYLCFSVTESEVDRAKNFYKTKILYKNESAWGTCLDIGRWTLYNGYRPSLLQKMKAVDKVTAADVRAACEKYFYDRSLAIAAIGQVEGLLDYNRYHARMYRLRT